MRTIFTSAFFSVTFLIVTFSSYAQCTQTTANFNTGTSTQGFTGTQTFGTGTFSALAVSNNQLRSTVTANSTNTYVITSPTFSTPAILAPVNFTFEYGDGPQANVINVQYSIKYLNTSNTVVQTPAANYTSGTCTSVARPGDMVGSNYQVVAIYTVASGTGNASNSYLSFDNFGTNGTAAQATLPVKFSSLEARMENNSVSLNWNVGTEENVSGYQIGKSADGGGYSAIGFVNASGEGSYSFTDTKPFSITYYRIKSIDLDGRYGYSTVAMVKAGKAMIILKAFPTPFVKNVSIQHPTAVAGSTITISSEDGRIVKTIVPSIGTQQTDIDLSSSKAGLYLVRYSDGTGQIEALKIMKQ